MKHLLMYYSIFEPSSGANPQDSSISLASYMLFSTHKLNKYLFAITSVSPLLVIIFPCQQAHRLHMRRKLFLILNSEIIAFCEKIYAPFMGVSFYPGNSIIKIIVLPTSLHKHLSLITLYSYHTNSGIYYS